MTVAVAVREQFYVFVGPDGWAWCEMFGPSWHVTAPTPWRSVRDALVGLERLHPGCIVDEIVGADAVDALRFVGAR